MLLIMFLKKIDGCDITSAVRQSISAINRFMKTGESTRFTRTHDARSDFNSKNTSIGVASYISRYLMQNARERVAESEIESKIYFEIFRQGLKNKNSDQMETDLINCFCGNINTLWGFSRDDIVEVALTSYVLDTINEMEKNAEIMSRNVQNNGDTRYGIKNLFVNPVALESCRDEVLSGRQIKIQNDILKDIKAGRVQNVRPRREYNLNDEMFAVTDIGRRRENQEDSVLILYHPYNSDYKMLVVADGMGGMDNGEKASQEIVQQMAEWFEKLPVGYLKQVNFQELQDMWYSKLASINQNIANRYPHSGSTFVGAIVGEKSTLIASVGDSRAYLLDNSNSLQQVTIDDNASYLLWRNKWDEYFRKHNGRISRKDYEKMMDEKDRLRYQLGSNVITKGVGIDDEHLDVKFTQIDNRDYKTLMLFSDGVTDCLSDNQIMKISNKTDKRDLAKAIVNEAISVNSRRKELEGDDRYKSVIAAGKDNTTAAVLDNEKGDQR